MLCILTILEHVFFAYDVLLSIFQVIEKINSSTELVYSTIAEVAGGLLSARYYKLYEYYGLS